MEEKNKQANYKVVLITSVFVLAAFGIGIYFGKQNSDKNNSNDLFVANASSSVSSVDMTPFWTVWKTLNDKFVYTQKNAKVITDQDKLYSAIEGLAASYGDPYTVFMPPEDSKTFTNDISGNFEGVGMELGIKGSSLVVVAPLKGTPAYNAGIKSGDIVLSIDGTSTEGMSVDKAVQLIRGKAGTAVDLKISRDSAASSLDIKITRAVINEPTIDTEIKGDVFVIKLYNFYATAPDQFRQALRDFVQSGKSKLVLDLRGNPGGYLEGAVDMASWFLPLGKVIVKEDFAGKQDEQIYRSKGYDAFNSNLRMAILVNEGSASASEIFSGALQEQGVAKLVGVKTFGKGCVQELLPITNDTSLKVTVAKWLTPSGKSITEEGLTPDYVVKISDTDLKAGKDPQMDKAIQVVDGLSN